MDANKNKGGFYGTENGTYYVNTAGDVFAWGTGDFDGARKVRELEAGARECSGSMSPDEMEAILAEIADEYGADAAR